MARETVKKKILKNIPVAVVHILATFNNTIVTVADARGAVIASSSAGAHGFKGAKKATPHAAQVTVEYVVKQATPHGVRQVSVELKGPGAGRESALRALQTYGLMVSSIRDVTPVAHNGCRPPKRRRV